MARQAWAALAQVWVALAVGLLLGSGGGAWAQVLDNAGDVRSVTLTLRAPNGTPLRGHALRVFAADPGPPGAAVGAGITDSRGQFVVTLPVGLRRVRVLAPGVGFGASGIFQVGPGQDVSTALPPLAPFAQVSGTVASALRLPGATIKVQDDYSDPSADHPPAIVDAQGRFHITDLVPGRRDLSIGGGPARTPSAYQSLTLIPGEARTGLVLMLPPTAPSISGRFMQNGLGSTRTVTLSGTVTDEGGHPVAGADVYAQPPNVNFNRSRFGDGPFNRNLPPLATVTGANGGYVFPAVTVFTNASTQIPVAASAPGYPPAVIMAQTAATGDVQAADLVLSTRHTALTVHGTGPDGKPAAGAIVRLGPEAGIPDVVPPSSGTSYGIFYGFGSNSGALHDLFVLVGTTGPDGVVRFVDMTPGLWDVSANTGPWQSSLNGSAAGVSVQVGHGASCALTLAALPTSPRVRVLSPTGQPVPVQNIDVNPGNTPSSFAGLVNLGSDPARDLPLPDEGYQPGLWRINANYRVGPQAQPSWYGNTTEPYTEAGVLVALSSALPRPGLLVLHAQVHAPGRLRVRLLSLDGKPAAGTVWLPRYDGLLDDAATVDAHGEAVFSGLPSSPEGSADGKYTVAGSLAGQSAPPDLRDDMPPPPDAVLTAQTLIEPLSVAVPADTETSVVLRAQRAGYIRVHLLHTKGAEDYQLIDDTAAYDRQTVSVHRDADAGTVLIGPLPAGKATLNLYHSIPSYTLEGNTTVAVNEGHVTDISLTPSDRDPQQILAKLDGLSLLYHKPPEFPPVLPGIHIYLADGVTPAWGAAAIAWPPSNPSTDARADALGRLQPGTFERSEIGRPQYVGDPPLPPPTGADPTEPTLIVWLPGLTGATLVPYIKGQGLRAVLPAPNTLVGQVTIGGRPAAGLPGTVRVRAAYQGRGRLNDLLSRDVTVSPGGTFTLPGLTAGTYQVQAARDGLWLSATQTVTVPDGGGPLPAVTLNIGPPGAPITLHLTPGAIVAMDRPAGPLTAELWPATVHADGVGDLRLDGLEAGPHTVRPVGGGPAIAFTVPEIPTTETYPPASPTPSPLRVRQCGLGKG